MRGMLVGMVHCVSVPRKEVERQNAVAIALNNENSIHSSASDLDLMNEMSLDLLLSI